MPLARTAKLTLHFQAWELGADHPQATDQVVENARAVAAWLENVRSLANALKSADTKEHMIVVNDPSHMARGFRPPDVNKAVGGSTTTDHDEGLAADFQITGMTPYSVYRMLTLAQSQGKLPEYDQLIWYVADSHIHVGLGPRMRKQLLLKTAEGSYVQLAGELVQRLRGFV